MIFFSCSWLPCFTAAPAELQLLVQDLVEVCRKDWEEGGSVVGSGEASDVRLEVLEALEGLEELAAYVHVPMSVACGGGCGVCVIRKYVEAGGVDKCDFVRV